MIEKAARLLSGIQIVSAAVLNRYLIVFKAVLVLSLLNLFPTKHWLLEINSNLGGYYLLAHLSSVLLGILAFKSVKSGIIFWTAQIVMISHYGMSVAPFFVFQGKPIFASAQAAAAGAEPNLRLFYANVHGPNEQHAETRAEISKSSAAVLALVELTPQWLRGLALEADYPYRIVVPRDDNYGLGLFSRFPLEAISTSVGDEFPPVIYATLRPPERAPVALILLHAMPPVSSEAFISNRIMLRRISTLLRHGLEDVIVLGDFNATPFSDFYKRFQNGSRIEDAMAGFGLLRSWNARHQIFRFTFDHVFYRGRFAVESFVTLPAGGSDHFPYLVDMRLR